MRCHFNVDPPESLIGQAMLGHRRLDHAGGHRVAPYSLCPVLAGDVGGQRGEPALGGRICSATKTSYHGKR
ncbi:hypothetical protein MMMB2_4900 [Mycobacterium marinum MB2]|nr:hypothetical protein MMMB2_4900 [Mycobacterium marinum MB2]